MNTQQANEMTIDQIADMTPLDAANFLRALNGDDMSALWTPSDAKQVLKQGWANGNSADARECAALEIIANAKDINY